MNATNIGIGISISDNKTSIEETSKSAHTSYHGTSALDKDSWRARQNRKPLKVTRKKWLSEK